jgi:hypothetical protein
MQHDRLLVKRGVGGSLIFFWPGQIPWILQDGHRITFLKSIPQDS